MIRIQLMALLPIVLTTQIVAQINVPASVLTQRNDVQRTGVYRDEAVLTPSVVSGAGATRFTRLVIRKVDGQVAAQPLYVRGVTISGVKKNVLYVVTRKNMIYAFDADNVNQNDPHKGMVWANPILLQDWDTPGSERSPLFASPLAGMDDGPKHCLETHGPVGITSTPVIDPVSQIMYLVARFGPMPSQTAYYGSVAYYYLVALDIRTGQELKRVQIQNRPQPGIDPFNASAQLNRPGLLLLNGVLYIAFGAPVCDSAEYDGGPSRPTHGWIFAYSAMPNMVLLDAYNTSPQNQLASIWQSGTGLAADPVGHFVYALTGNNRDADKVALTETGQGADRDDLYYPTRTDLGESILKLSLGPNNKFQCEHRTGPYCVTSHFTAGNWYRLDTSYHSPTERVADPLGLKCKAANYSEGQCAFDGDSDIGSGGATVLSNGWVVGGGKQGRLYVIDPNDMKHAKQGFLAAINTFHQGSGPSTCLTINPADQPGCVVSTTPPNDDSDVAPAWGANIHGNPAVWQRPSSSFSFLYLMAEKDYLRAYRILSTGQIVEKAEMTTANARPPYPRGFPNGLRSPDGMPGAAVSVSSNGDQNGIVWVSVSPKDTINTIESGVLMAFDALSLKLLWFDDDPSILFAKFVPPTIAGGKVFRATFGNNDASGACSQNSPKNPSCGSIVIYGTSTRITSPKSNKSIHAHTVVSKPDR